MITPPSISILSITVALYGEIYDSSILDAQVKGSSLIAILSFIRNVLSFKRPSLVFFKSIRLIRFLITEFVLLAEILSFTISNFCSKELDGFI